MTNLVNYIFAEFFIPALVFFIAWKILESVRDSKMGALLTAGALGALAYFFLKNYTQVLEWLGAIAGRIFGG